jgi:hypothetical protein
MLSTREILLEYISPLLGAIFANMMFFAPMKDVRRAVQKGGLGHLNPTPWAVMTGNTLGWLTYSYLLKVRADFFLVKSFVPLLSHASIPPHRTTSYSSPTHPDSSFPSG